MSIKLREATRQNVKLLIGLAGTSGSGKTYSALMLAYGLAGKNGQKIAILDTENKRGSLYADSLPNNDKFLIADIEPPFPPSKLSEAILSVEKHGIDVVVLDSFTHFWESEGGAKDIAEIVLEAHFKCKKCGYLFRHNEPCPMCGATERFENKPKRVADWIRAKAEWKKMMNNLLMANCHVIVCLRARERVEVKKINDDLVYIPLGLQMITEKNAPFEMTASLMLHDSGKRQDVMKCPAELMPILGRGSGYLTIDDGFALRQWIDGGGKLNPEVERVRNVLQLTAESGTEAIRQAWEATPKDIRAALGRDFLETIKASAAEYDRQRAEANGGTGDEVS